ncbi:hypothetical protein MTO96_017257 [Rhipicephalus appendiculatus]
MLFIYNIACRRICPREEEPWVTRRVGPNGAPIDIVMLTRLRSYLMSLLPDSLANDYAESILNGFFNHEAYGLKPKHRYNAQRPTMNDELPNLILNGKVRVKKNIAEFTEDGVIFEGDDKATPLDHVILATGYQIKFPFLPKEVVSVEENQVQALQEYLPAPVEASESGHHRAGPADRPHIPRYRDAGKSSSPAAAWVAELLSKKRSLPSEEAMFESIRKQRESMRRRYVASPRHTIQVDWLGYLDDLASEIGARPNLLKYFFTDNEALPRAARTLRAVPVQARKARTRGPERDRPSSTRTTG